MMTSIVQEIPKTNPVSQHGRVIPPHVLIKGKKYALDYIAPALFRIGTFGELLICAKGSLNIVTAVNVAEMVKQDVAGLTTKSISIGTEESIIDRNTRRVSYIEIHLSKFKPAPHAEAAEMMVARTTEIGPVATSVEVEAADYAPKPAVEARTEQLAEAVEKSKKIRANPKKSASRKKATTTGKKKSST